MLRVEKGSYDLKATALFYQLNIQPSTLPKHYQRILAHGVAGEVAHGRLRVEVVPLEAARVAHAGQLGAASRELQSRSECRISART